MITTTSDDGRDHDSEPGRGRRRRAVACVAIGAVVATTLLANPAAADDTDAVVACGSSWS